MEEKFGVNPQKIMESLKDDYEVYLRDLNNVIEILREFRKCESPLEHLFLWELCRSCELVLISSPGLIMNTPAGTLFSVMPQHVLIEDRISARVDFLFEFYPGLPAMVGHLVVELDGHEFHEKTREQVARDKWRDRQIAALGYPIMHFTGTEIYRSISDVVAEVLDFINKAVAKH